MRKGIKLVFATAMVAVLMLGTTACGSDDTENSSSNSSTVQSEDSIVLGTSENGETILTLYKRDASDDTEVVIENSDDAPIKRIGEGAFVSNTTIQKVTLPDTITHIDRLAFRNCRALEEINFPDGLTTIGTGAFMGTSLKEVELPSSVTTIEESAFSSNSKLEKLTINEGVTKLENIVEGDGALKELHLPSTITEISEDFSVASSTVIYTPENSVVTDYCTNNGINYEIV